MFPLRLVSILTSSTKGVDAYPRAGAINDQVAAINTLLWTRYPEGVSFSILPGHNRTLFYCTQRTWALSLSLNWTPCIAAHPEPRFSFPSATLRQDAYRDHYNLEANSGDCALDSHGHPLPRLSDGCRESPCGQGPRLLHLLRHGTTISTTHQLHLHTTILPKTHAPLTRPGKVKLSKPIPKDDTKTTLTGDPPASKVSGSGTQGNEGTLGPTAASTNDSAATRSPGTHEKQVTANRLRLPAICQRAKSQVHGKARALRD